MSSIGNLLVRIGADTKKFNQGMKGVRADMTKTQKRVKSFKAGIAAIATVAAAAATAFAVATKKILDWGDKIAKTSTNLGVTTEFLSGMEYAAERTGTELSVVEMGIRRMSQAALDASDGLETYSRIFRRLDVDIYATNGSLKDSEILFMDLADAVSKMTDDTERIGILNKLFGRSGVKLGTMFKEGAAGIAAFLKEAEGLGGLLSAENAKAA